MANSNPVVEGSWQIVDDLGFIGCMLYSRWSAMRAGETSPFALNLPENAEVPMADFFTSYDKFWAIFVALVLIKGFTVSRAFAAGDARSAESRFTQVGNWLLGTTLRWADDALLIVVVMLGITAALQLGTSAPLTYSWDNFGFFSNHPRYWEQLLLAGTIKSSISRHFPRG